MNIQSAYNDAAQSMLFSAGVSGLLSALLRQGDPLTMAAIGALASLTYSVAVAIFKGLNIDAASLKGKTDLPVGITVPLQIVCSLACTRWILEGTKRGHPFSIALTAIASLAAMFATFKDIRPLNNVFFIILR